MTLQVQPPGSSSTTVDLGSAPTAGPGLPPDVSALTPDALMTYCQTQVGGLDDQIKAYFDKQQGANAQRAALNDVLATLNAHINGFLQDGGDTTTCDALESQMQKAIDAAGGPSTALGAQLQSIKNDIHATGRGDDSKMSGDEVKAFVDRVKNIQSDITNTSELDMIQLQSLSQKRSTALQLCTNLVQSFGDQANKISANVGH